jgi:hypothetical protein
MTSQAIRPSTTSAPIAIKIHPQAGMAFSLPFDRVPRFDTRRAMRETIAARHE